MGFDVIILIVTFAFIVNILLHSMLIHSTMMLGCSKVSSICLHHLLLLKHGKEKVWILSLQSRRHSSSCCHQLLLLHLEKNELLLLLLLSDEHGIFSFQEPFGITFHLVLCNLLSYITHASFILPFAQLLLIGLLVKPVHFSHLFDFV
jgi:hypothetical protein